MMFQCQTCRRAWVPVREGEDCPFCALKAARATSGTRPLDRAEIERLVDEHGRWSITRSSSDPEEDVTSESYSRCRECGRITKGEGPALHRKSCTVPGDRAALLAAVGRLLSGDRWATLITEGEAANCYPCDTCRGFRAPGRPCGSCANKEATHEALQALTTAHGKHAKWNFDRMFGAVEGRDLYDSKAFVDAIETLVKQGVK